MVFFKVLRLRVRKEIEELKSLHRIEMAEKEAEFERKQTNTDKLNEIKQREIVSLLRLESEQKTKQLELDHQRNLEAVKQKAAVELINTKEKMLNENYEKLTAAMARLHEGGNVTTRFTQDLALKMMGSMPEHKLQTKVITSGKANE